MYIFFENIPEIWNYAKEQIEFVHEQLINQNMLTLTFKGMVSYISGKCKLYQTDTIIIDDNGKKVEKDNIYYLELDGKNKDDFKLHEEIIVKGQIYLCINDDVLDIKLTNVEILKYYRGIIHKINDIKILIENLAQDRLNSRFYAIEGTIKNNSNKDDRYCEFIDCSGNKIDLYKSNSVNENIDKFVKMNFLFFCKLTDDKIYLNLYNEYCSPINKLSTSFPNFQVCKIIHNCQYHSFNTRAFPYFPGMSDTEIQKSIAFLTPEWTEIPILEKLKDEYGLGTKHFKYDVENLSSLINLISKLSEYKVLFLTNDGFESDFFSSSEFLNALNGVPMKQFRLLALNFSYNVPLSFLFSDAKAFDINSGYVLLDKLSQFSMYGDVEISKDMEDLEKQNLYKLNAVLRKMNKDACDSVVQCVQEFGIESFTTRFFPYDFTSIAFIMTSSFDTPIYSDIVGEFNNKYETIVKRISIKNPDEIVDAIADCKKADILFIAQGGMDTEAFSDKKVLQALCSTPANQFRILALGHSTCLPLAYYFCDAKAQTPSSGGSVLQKLREAYW